MEIEEYLLSLELEPQLKGFRYVATAIRLCQEDVDYLYNLTTKLYPKIAKMYNDTYTKVERALRTVIYKRFDDVTVGKFIGTSLIELKKIYSETGKNTTKRKCKNV